MRCSTPDLHRHCHIIKISCIFPEVLAFNHNAFWGVRVGLACQSKRLRFTKVLLEDGIARAYMYIVRVAAG